MLVLSRRVGEEIIINENIRVTVVAVKGDRIRLGIEAPRDVSVDRAEVHVRRMQFQLDPVGAAVDSHSSDADVPIGVMPGKHEDDTLVH
ncbi:MAG: carbon storage regulator [Gemmataceae bacterium]|nr:carbon storage regulator [Gemmataceae bacterium]